MRFVGNKKFLSSFIILVLFLIFNYLQSHGKTNIVGNSSSPTPTIHLQVQGVASESGVLVTKVIDGDTIELSTGQKVRYIGIDTPETKDPRRTVECFGKQAAAENKKLVEGHVVFLEKDVSETDKYGRLLRYVYMVNPHPEGEGSQTYLGLFVNEYLVKEGFANASAYPPDVKYQELLETAEKKAQLSKKGLWGACLQE